MSIFDILFQCKKKNDKIVWESQQRLARISILGFYDSSEANSSNDTDKGVLPCITLLKWGKGKILLL